MELEVIPLANMWPDPNNPRKDFGDLDALADTFEMNTVRPMEPVNPPTVVPDGVSAHGQMYRIVDGERRWRAMVKRGAVESCAAIVCSMDEANAMAAMVATDDKAQLTDAELSRGVQQMLAVGVAPEKVDKAARLKKGTARRVAKVTREGTEQMSIGHLLAAEEAGDDEAVERVLAASEGDYERVADKIRRERETVAKVAALREACEAASVPLAETAEEASGEGRSYSACADASNVAKVFAGQSDGTVGWICENNWSGPEVRFYSPEHGESPEDAARRADEARTRKLMEDAGASRSAWLCRQLVEREDFCLFMLPIVEAYRASNGKPPEPYDYSVGRWLKKQGMADKLVETGHIVGAFVGMGYDPLWTGYVDGAPRPSAFAADWLALGDVIRSLGYRPAPDEQELAGMVQEAIERFSKKKEEEEDDGSDE